MLTKTTMIGTCLSILTFGMPGHAGPTTSKTVPPLQATISLGKLQQGVGVLQGDISLQNVSDKTLNYMYEPSDFIFSVLD